MKVSYGAMITVVGSLNLGEKERQLSISELAEIHDVIQSSIHKATQTSLKNLSINVSKVVILNLDSDNNV